MVDNNLMATINEMNAKVVVISARPSKFIFVLDVLRRYSFLLLIIPRKSKQTNVAINVEPLLTVFNYTKL
jgi:hypothetical protein